MGLYKRGQVWWMRFTYKGKQHRVPTETKDKKLAEKIHRKVMTRSTRASGSRSPLMRTRPLPTCWTST